MNETDVNETDAREAAFEKVRTIWRLASEVEKSGYRDLELRASEIRSMAHFMLYDADAGIEEDR